MKHDFRASPEGSEAERFCDWLQSETTAALARDYRNAEATKATIFLFANRAFEAHMPEPMIASIFAKSVVSAGYREEEQEPAFAWLEAYAQIARGVHEGT